MRIEPSSIAYLRLIPPAGAGSAAKLSSLGAVSQAQPVAPVQPVRRSEATYAVGGDSLHFQTLTGAASTPDSAAVDGAKVQRMRQKLAGSLVAARTDVPIHFQDATARPAPRANPYAAAYMKFPISSAELNANATEARS